MIELFAGGASVGLTAAIENLADHVILVEKDEDVASVWQAIIEGDALWLAEKVLKFDLNNKNIEEALDLKDRSLRDRAFATLLSNRISRGGILAKRGGRMKNGERGNGLKSRWYPETLASRILKIADYKDKLTVIYGDAMDVLEANLKTDAVFFIDPPYTVAGKRLYTHSELDHARLFELSDSLEGSFLMTYDKTDQIQNLADKHNFQTQDILMRTTHLKQKTELIISKDLSWL